jgi:hypothetical protein
MPERMKRKELKSEACRQIKGLMLQDVNKDISKLGLPP